jgi:hypothetical protein
MIHTICHGVGLKTGNHKAAYSCAWTNLSYCFFREYEDLTTGQMMLQDLVERQGIPVFESVPIALNCTAKVSNKEWGFP